MKRFDVVLVDLEPTIGSEIRKTRPCAIVSPDVMNHALSTIIIAPMTSTIKRYPTRVATRFKNRNGEIALDQIRSISKQRVKKNLGKLTLEAQKKICSLLEEMFSFN